MFADVLLPVDDPEAAGAALEHAVSIAATYDGTVHALSVHGPAADGADGTGAALEDVERRCDREGVPVVRAVGRGGPVEVILRYATGVDLVVLGARSRGPLARLLGTGLAQQVSARATVPVFVVPAAAAGTRPPYRRVLLATDGQAGSRRAEGCAFALAGAYGAALDALYVVDSRFGESGALHTLLDRAADSVRRELRARAAREGTDVTVAVREGRPAAEILDYAATRDADLLVVGTQGRAGIERVLMGSVAQRVLGGASVPVVTARATGDDG